MRWVLLMRYTTTPIESAASPPGMLLAPASPNTLNQEILMDRDDAGDRSFLDNVKHAVSDALTGGEESGPTEDYPSDPTRQIESIEAPDNRGNFGTMEDIERDNTAAKR